jgi:hypothetical protein
MSTSSTRPTPDATPSEAGGFLAPRPGSHPGSHCIRCGKPTPAGASLCPEDNPGGVKSPSATQMHATILAGVAVGVVGLLLLFRVAVGQGGPYTAVITERTMDPSGAPSIVVSVSNTGDGDGVATCRVTRDGAARPDDPTYRTERIAPGASATLARVVPAPPIATAPYDLERMTVICT